MSTQTSHLQCLCGKVYQPASSIDAEKYPIRTHFCHCNTCRQTSGALGGTFVKLTSRPSDAALNACTTHTLSGGQVDRYFCSTCGTRTFNHVTTNGYWSACSGMVERKDGDTDGDVSKIAGHALVSDTIDGGLAARMLVVGSEKLTCFAGLPIRGNEMTTTEIAQLTENKPATRKGKETERLRVACRCESIQCFVSPPTPPQTQDPAIAKWLRADGAKYLALNCVCRYCRLAVGYPITSYTYVMPENIHFLEQHGTETRLFCYTSFSKGTINFDLDSQSIQAKLPMLRFDFTSPGIRRSFCGKCGASVFFERATRPQCVNIAVGVLRADSGSLAREWIDFDWKNTCWKEQAANPAITAALELVRSS